LRIVEPDQSVRWLYESRDITSYLRAHFGTPQARR
jgi:hypothetical protein